MHAHVCVYLRKCHPERSVHVTTCIIAAQCYCCCCNDVLHSPYCKAPSPVLVDGFSDCRGPEQFVAFVQEPLVSQMQQKY